MIHNNKQDIQSVIAKKKFVIHHGGVGLCQVVLAMGKPQVILPTHPENHMNGRALEKQGLGIVVKNWQKLSAQETLGFIFSKLN